MTMRSGPCMYRRSIQRQTGPVPSSLFCVKLPVSSGRIESPIQMCCKSVVITRIEAFLLKGQLRWVGHVMRMPENRIPKQVFFGQLASGKRPQRGPARRYKDTLRINLKQCNINPGSLTSATSDRSSWRTLCHKAVTEFEDSHVLQH